MTRNVPGMVVLFAAASLVGCGEDPVGLDADAYLLVAVEGEALPYTIGVTDVPDFGEFHDRILGRVIRILSGETLEYEWARDVLRPDGDGELQRWSFECEARSFPYRVADGALIIRTAGDDAYPTTIREDTLEITGDGLIQYQPVDVGPALRLRYDPGDTTTVCPR